MKKPDKLASVRRITVDERLSDDLIRLEICELKRVDESGEILDEPGFWTDISSEGNDVLARPANPQSKSRKNLYTDLMGIPETHVDVYPWKDLTEGQVFLSGEFEVREEQREEETIKRYFASPGKKAFERIDDDVKKHTKALYYEVLAKGEKDGKL